MRKSVRWARRLARRSQFRWAAIAFAFVAVLVLGLLGAGFLSSPGSSHDDPPAATKPLGTGAAPQPSRPAETADPRSVRQAEYPSEIPPAVRAALPYNPLNHLGASDVHTVVLRVSSRTDSTFGYLVPTGLTDTYGKKKTSGGSWTLEQKAVGPGHLAVVFIQADAQGTSLSCRITVDGKVTSTETVSSPYARALCLG